MWRLQRVQLPPAAFLPWATTTKHRTVASAMQQDTDYASMSPSDMNRDVSSADAVLPDFPTQFYDRQYANYVSLVGHLGVEPEFMVFPSGRSLSKMRLAVNRGAEPDRVTDWYDVEAWGDLAKQCHQHLRTGAWINIQGRLKVDSWTDKETQAKRTKCLIVANTIERMQSPLQSPQMQGGGSAQYSTQAYVPQQPSAAYSTSGAGHAYAENSIPAPSYGGSARSPYQVWSELVSNPSAFWDNRENKRNPKAPDFKHKTTGEGLWLDSAPAALRDQLAALGLSGSVPY